MRFWIKLHTIQVRNERAEDFLSLLKKWEELVVSWRGCENSQQQCEAPMADEDDDDDEANDEEEFEVEKVISICYGDPKDIDKPGLYFKVTFDPELRYVLMSLVRKKYAQSLHVSIYKTITKEFVIMNRGYLDPCFSTIYLDSYSRKSQYF